MLKPQPQSSAATASVSASPSSAAVATEQSAAAAGAEAAVEPPVADKRLRLVAVVGSAHVPGVLRFVQAADSLAASAAAHLDSSAASPASSTASSIADSSVDGSSAQFSVDAARDSLVAAGFLPPRTVRPLGALFPGQGLPALAPAPSPAAAAAAAAKTADAAAPAQLESTGAAPSEPVAAAVARRALVRAVAACAVDDQIMPTLQLEPGHAFANTYGPIGALTLCCVAPFVRRLPLRVRIGASLALMSVAGLNLGASIALRKYGERISGALDAIDARLASQSAIAAATGIAPAADVAGGAVSNSP